MKDRVRSLLLMLAALGMATALPAPAQAFSPKALEKTLRARWVGRARVLRGFPLEDSLSVDQNGKLLKPVATGDWTESYFQIEGVSVGRRDIKLKGSRVIAVFVKGDKGHPSTFKLFDVPQTLIAIDVNVAPASLDGAAIARLERGLFFGDIANLVAAVPKYWQAYLAPAASPPNNPFAGLPNAWYVQAYPTPLHDPDPIYSAYAKADSIAGKVVLQGRIGIDGTVSDLRILQPLGAGLDRQAVQTVRTWRFRPGIAIYGLPTSVIANFEVNFRPHP